MNEFSDIEHRVRDMADVLDEYVTPHPIDALEMAELNPDARLDHDDHIAMDLLLGAAVRTYWDFLGPTRSLARPVTYDEVYEQVYERTYDNQYMIWGREDVAAKIAHAYLSGQGKDYQSFLKFG
jgi:hypothetical protein